MGVKQVIVMRNDLNMRKGKMIAQGAHAAMKVFFDRGDLGYYWRSGASGSLFEGEDDPGNPGAFAMLITLTRAMWAWANGSFTKVVVRADSEEQLLDLNADPYEKTHFTNDPKYASKLAKLRKEYKTKWFPAAD